MTGNNRQAATAHHVRQRVTRELLEAAQRLERVASDLLIRLDQPDRYVSVSAELELENARDQVRAALKGWTL